MIRNFGELMGEAKRSGPVRIAVVLAHDPDVLGCFQEAEAEGLAEPILIGDPGKIEKAASQVGYHVRRETLREVPAEDAAIREAVELVRRNEADLLMKGKVTTAQLIRGVLDRERGLRTGRLLSQVIALQVPGVDRLILMTDAALNIAPNLEQKADLCRNTIELAHALGIAEPNVVLLTALEFVNPAMPATQDAACLVQMNRRGQIAGAYLEGPLALDVPLSRFAADRKGIQSRVVEATDVLIAPNIEAANILYRAATYFAHAPSGGIIVGAKAPLVLLSRAEPPETKLHSIGLAVALLRHQQKAGEGAAG
jgi:phosphate butyryltransferase